MIVQAGRDVLVLTKVKHIEVILQVNVIGENRCAYRFKVENLKLSAFEMNCCCKKKNRDKCIIPRDDDLQICASGNLTVADGRGHYFSMDKMPLKTVWFHFLHGG